MFTDFTISPLHFSRSAFDAHTDPIFKSLKMLKFENIVSLQVAKIMYLYKNGQLPESFNNMFFTGEEIHNYNTRNKFFFVYLFVGQMYENSHFDFKDLKFLIQ